MSVPNRDIHWCNGCRSEFPLKLLKRCGACRIDKYCSLECQKSAWKGGHGQLCRQVVAQKDMLKGWSGTWDAFLRWVAVRAFDLTNKPGNHRNRCLEIELKKTGSADIRHAYQVIDACVGTLNVTRDVRFESGSDAQDDILNNLYIALLVRGENDELVDALGCAWGLPNSIYDTPERSKIWAKYFVFVMESIVVNSKPQHAIRDATLMMETLFPALRRLEICPMCVLQGSHGRGSSRFCIK